MNKSHLYILTIVFLSGLLGGCASTARDNSLSGLEKSVADQSGYQVQWNSTMDDNGEVSEEVRKLLQKNLTADTAVQIALINNRRLQAAFEELGIARATFIQARLPENPVLDGTVRFLEDGEGEVINFALTESILQLLLMPSKKAFAGAKMEMARFKVAIAVMDLALEARIAFYAYQSAVQLQEMRKSVFSASEASYDMAQRMHKAGNMTDLDLANECALYEQAKLDVSSAEMAVVETREQVNALLGLWGKDSGWKGEERLPEIPEMEMSIENAEKKAIEKSLDLALAKKEFEAVAKKFGIDQTELVIPDLRIGVESEKSETDEWSYGPTITISLPVFNRGQALKPGAEAELRRQWKEYLALAVEIRSETRTAVYRMNLARQRAIYYKNVMLPLRHRITDETQQKYNAMLVGVFQLLQARQQEIEAGARYITELHNYWISRAKLEQILNGRMVKGAPRKALMPVNGGDIFAASSFSRTHD
jgi:outer membrane protein, heavy metal efflux system